MDTPLGGSSTKLRPRQPGGRIEKPKGNGARRNFTPLDEAPNAPVSWQVGTTVAALLERVDALPVDNATQKTLEALRMGRIN